MNLKVYRKTRYQNIYQHIKNKNYMVEISKPVKTSISRIDGEKIWKLEEALKIRDNPEIKIRKGVEVANRDDFDTLWCKYIDECKTINKQAYNTIIKKEKIYNYYLKNNLPKMSKLTTTYISNYINELDTTDKQKNMVIKILKTFFNWCKFKKIIFENPMDNIKKYRVTKTEMKYWVPEQLTQFLNTVNYDIEHSINSLIAYRVKIFTLVGFALGDRVGETRALSFDCFDKEKGTVKIKHSINYDTNSDDFLSSTKTYNSEREIDVSEKLIDEVLTYKQFLIDNDYNVKDDSIIFFNYESNKPYSDTALRNHFKKYCIKAEVPYIRPYDLRHTYVATMMAEGKELYHISERLGHTNYNTTVNKYGHLSNKVRKEIAETTDKYY